MSKKQRKPSSPVSGGISPQVSGAIVDKVMKFVSDIAAILPSSKLKERMEKESKRSRKGILALSFTLYDPKSKGDEQFGTKDTPMTIEEAEIKIEELFGSGSEFGVSGYDRPSEVIVDPSVKDEASCEAYGKAYRKKSQSRDTFVWTKWVGGKLVCRRLKGRKPAPSLVRMLLNFENAGLKFKDLWFTDWDGKTKQYLTASELYDVIQAHEEKLTEARTKADSKA